MKRLGLLGLWLLSGCLTAVSIQMPHPLTRGVIVDHVIPSSDTQRAATYGLPPETFTSEARMNVLDAERVCFALTLRINGDQGNLAVPGEWRVYLRGDNGLENNQPVFGPPLAPTMTAMNGSVARQQLAGYYNNCTRVGGSLQCSQQPRYVTVRVPAVVNVLTGTGAVCFAHGGSVSRNTRQITLHLDDPDNALHRLAFRWNLVP